MAAMWPFVGARGAGLAERKKGRKEGRERISLLFVLVLVSGNCLLVGTCQEPSIVQGVGSQSGSRQPV